MMTRKTGKKSNFLLKYVFLVLKWQGNLILSEKIGLIVFCECYGSTSNFIITMPPRTQYLPVAGISPTDP